MLLFAAPNLSSLRYKDNYDVLDLSADFRQLEKVDICFHASFDNKEKAHKIVSLLQQLHSVKSLTLNSEIIKSLSSYVELISNQPSPFTNLKTLKIYPHYVTQEEDNTKPDVTVPFEIKNYLFDSSSGATFTMVSKEEIRADRNAASARKLMKDFQDELDQLKKYMQTDIDQDNASVEVEDHNAQPDMEVKGYFGKNMTRVKSLWDDLKKQLKKGYKDVGHVISKLREIEEVLAKLPASHRDKLHTQFSRLCTESGNIMDNIMDDVKSQFDKKPRFKSLLS